MNSKYFQVSVGPAPLILSQATPMIHGYDEGHDESHELMKQMTRREERM